MIRSEWGTRVVMIEQKNKNTSDIFVQDSIINREILAGIYIDNDIHTWNTDIKHSTTLGVEWNFLIY